MFYYHKNLIHFYIRKEAFPPRLHYDDFFNSLLTTTIVFLNEEWHIIMWDHMRIIGYYSSIYFMIVLILGRFFFINVFTALFIDKFIESANFKNNFSKHLYKKLALIGAKIKNGLSSFSHKISRKFSNGNFSNGTKQYPIIEFKSNFFFSNFKINFTLNIYFFLKK